LFPKCAVAENLGRAISQKKLQTQGGESPVGYARACRWKIRATKSIKHRHWLGNKNELINFELSPSPSANSAAVKQISLQKVGT